MGEDRAAGGRGTDRSGTDQPRAARRPAAGLWVPGLALFAATFAAGVLGYSLPGWGARLPLPILPSGVAVGALVRYGRRLWPAVFAAELAIELWRGTGRAAAVVIACALPAGSWVTARILERRGFGAEFARARDVPLFIAAAFVGMALTATVGDAGLGLIGPSPFAFSPLYWLRWWSNASVGVLLLAPLLITLRRASLAPLRARPAHTLVFLGALLATAIALALISDPLLAPVLRSPIVVLSLLLVVVGAMRFGLVTAAAATLLLSALAALSFAFDRGLMSGLPELGGLVLLWSFVGALTGIVLIVTALLAERDAAAAERLRAERRYAEVFEASPQPLWVHDPLTLAFLLVNAATERQYGYGREALLGMRVTDLAAPGEEHPVPGPDAVPHADGEPFETRHLSRDGRVLEVEMWTRPIDFGGQGAVLVFATDVTERKALGRALIEAIAGEQRRIGQEMHDGLGQELTGLSLSLRALATRAGRDRLPLAADLEQLAALVATCIQSARRIVHGLSPLAGADGNLVAALNQLAEAGSAGDLKVRLSTRLEAPLTLPLEARNHLFRIAQEALQNAQKHSGARHVDIELGVRADSVRLAILDDGRGPPDPARPDTGLGMRTMRYRAASVRGRLSVRPRSPAGTAVLLEAPQPPAQAAALSA